jgi:hypothetical protein
MVSFSKLTGVHYALMICAPTCVLCGLGWVRASRENEKIRELMSGTDVTARNTESKKFMEFSRDQTLKLDAEIVARTRLEEQLGTLQLDLKAAELKNLELLSVISIYQQALEAAGIASNTTEPADDGPAPRLEGLVGEIMAGGQQGGSERVEISLGSNQGLKNQDEMTVYRSAAQSGQRAKFLANIVILDTAPDKAVAGVIEATRHGLIRKGDKVIRKR